MRIKKLLTHNIALKLLAFILAFITWLYVGEVTKTGEGKTALQKLFSSTPYVAKRFEIKPIFVGKPPVGYKFFEDRVEVSPGYIVVVGPPKILAQKEYIYTKAIDLSEHTKTKTIDIEVENIAPSISFERTKVQVYLEIEALEEDKTIEN